MKHRSSRTLFEHWDQRRGAQQAPERSAIDPGAIRSALSDVFILAFSRLKGHPFRLAGTRVCALVGRELKEQPFQALWRAGQTQEVLRLLDLIANESVGVVAGVSGQAADGQSIELEMMMLPLLHWGQTHSRFIGALAPLSVPYWFGTQPVGPLALGDYRYLGMRAPDSVVTLPVPQGERRMRHGLVVYDGGQS